MESCNVKVSERKRYVNDWLVEKGVGEMLLKEVREMFINSGDVMLNGVRGRWVFNECGNDRFRNVVMVDLKDFKVEERGRRLWLVRK